MTDYPMFLEEHIETMPRGDIERLQEGRLMAMLAFAYERAPLIRETWRAAGISPKDIRSLADFYEKAPFIDKEAIRSYRDTHSDPCGGLKAVADEELSVVSSTSGTTGDPTPILIKPQSPTLHAYNRAFWHIGARPGDHIVQALFTMRLGHLQPIAHEPGWINIHLGHFPQDVPRIFEASKRYAPAILNMLSVPMMAMIEKALEQSGTDPREIFKSYKGAIYGGEVLGERNKALAQSWGLEPFCLGAIGDVIVGLECKAHAGLHANEDFVLVECLDPDGTDPIPDGEVGELVVTALADRFTPQIRYRTEDLVRVFRAPCTCGSTHARVQLLGRKGDQVLVNGRSVMVQQVQGHISNHPATRAGLFQIVRTTLEMDYLHLRIGHDPASLPGTLEELAAELHEVIAKDLGVPVRIEITMDSELLKLGPPHKIPRVTKF